jgi:type VI secretion system protein ImpF
VREPRPIKGAKALLFERLVDENPPLPGEGQPFRIYGVAALRASVGRELMRLLNTRCPRSGGPANETERTILDYGIPDFSHMSAGSDTDALQLARILESVISVYEPRLRHVRVTIQPSKESRAAVTGAIEGMLAVGTVNEPVSFPLLLSLKSGEVVLTNAE